MQMKLIAQCPAQHIDHEDYIYSDVFTKSDIGELNYLIFRYELSPFNAENVTIDVDLFCSEDGGATWNNMQLGFQIGSNEEEWIRDAMVTNPSGLDDTDKFKFGFNINGEPIDQWAFGAVFAK